MQIELQKTDLKATKVYICCSIVVHTASPWKEHEIGRYIELCVYSHASTRHSLMPHIKHMSQQAKHSSHDLLLLPGSTRCLQIQRWNCADMIMSLSPDLKNSCRCDRRRIAIAEKAP